MNSEINSLGYENNIQTIPELHLFPEKNTSKGSHSFTTARVIKLSTKAAKQGYQMKRPIKNHSHIKYLLYENASRSI
ncbi:TPA: hypothetical protein ACHJO6_002873 [Klebsiella pneumoniae]